MGITTINIWFCQVCISDNYHYDITIMLQNMSK